MNMKNTANEILHLIGGQENVTSLSHCVTRLRFTLVDENVADEQALKKLDGVLGVARSSGQFQVIIGPEVAAMYSELMKTLNIEEASSDRKKEKLTIKGILKTALDTLISCFVPAISVIAGSGMIKVLAVLLSYAGIIQTDSTTYIILNTIGDGVFYFLPFFVAYNAAKKMNVDIFLSMVIAAVLLHPDISALGDAGSYVGFFGMGMKIVDYSAQALPVIFGVWLLKYVDKYADKFSPNIVKVFLRPMISLLIVVPIMLLLVGPATALLGDGFAVICNIMNEWGWLAVGINAALFPIMVLTGTHNATIPLLVQMFATQGFDSVFLPSGMAANIAEAGAAGAVAFKTKNKSLRGIAVSASFSALLGITEPALYGVNLRLKKPFVAMLLGSALGGCYIGLIGLTAPTFVTPSILTTPIFVGAGVNFLLGLSSIPVVYFITFFITYIIGFEDVTDENGNMISSPIQGEIIPLDKVNDAAFSTKTMGDGFAVVPSEGKVYAPFDGKVELLFPTKHALGLKRTDGLELLIHIGFDTVNLKGKGFQSFVKQGDYVKKGTLLMEFDKNELEKMGYDITTAVVVTNSASYSKINVKKTGTVEGKESVLYVE